MFVTSILSFWQSEDPDSFENAARDFGLGPVATRAARDALERESYTRWYFLIAGLSLTLWFGIGAVRALRVTHYVAWNERPEKLSRPLVAGGTFTFLAVLLIVASAATAWAREELGPGGIGITLLAVVLYAGGAFGMMRLLPHRDAPPKALIPGAVLVSVGVQGVHLAVVLYLAPKLGRSSQLYGSLGAATVVLLWLYISARLIVSAAFLNATLWDRRTH